MGSSGSSMGAAATAAGEEVVKQANFPSWHEGLFVLLIALVSALASEFLAWYFIYRKDEYQRKKAYLVRLCRMYEKRQREVKLQQQAAAGDGGGKKVSADKKQLERLEKDLRNGQADVTKLAMKSNLIIGVVTSAVFFVVSKRFSGHVMAKLPFWPWKLVQNLSHRGIPGEDATDSSFMFLYVLANMGLRSSIQKLCGSAPLRTLDDMANPLLAGLEEDEDEKKPASQPRKKEGKHEKRKRS